MEAVKKTVTCSFVVERDLYDRYKSIVVRNHQNVKGNLIRHMQEVIEYNEPNSETLEAIKEVELMKKDPSIGKEYSDVDAMMEELLK